MIQHLFKKCILLLLIFILAISNVNAEANDQNTKVVLRAIGHEYLLQLSDSTSRVLPIEKIGDRYLVKFENEFSFEPDLLFFGIFKTLEANRIEDSYIVEVENCETKELIHSFKISLKEEDNMTHCRTRLYPKDCYVFYFTLVDSVKEATNIIKEGKKKSWVYLLPIFILLIIIFVALKKRNKNSNQNQSFIHIGQYNFDQKGMKLIFKSKRIELSSKESDLLFLLFSNEGKTLKREEILESVWENGDDYIGRTLDVFISKLRKKLELDSSIKIVNIRGVGYKFVIH